jgi:hypothetical protein
MALREKLRERVQPLLEPGEQIQAVFLAQTGPNPNFMFLTWLVLFWTKYNVAAVTDKRIAVFRASRMAPSKPRELAASYPRESKLGDSSGALWGSFELDGTKYWVHRRFRKDVRAADDAAPAPSA